MNIISKIGTTSFPAAHQRSHEPASPPPARASNPNTLPSLSTSAMAVSGNMDTSIIGLSDNQLKRQGLECLVTVLRSLVLWGTATKDAAEPALDSARTSHD